MDNVGDWLYIVFLIIAAVSGLFSSKDKKKKSRPDILGQPDREIVPNDQPTEGKGFWEILEDMQKETQKPKPAPRQKQVKSKVEKPQVVTSSPASSPFLSAEKNIPNHIATQPSVRMSLPRKTGAYARRYLQRHRGIEESDHLCGDSKPEVLIYATLIFDSA